jgi:hypothetical protein
MKGDRIVPLVGRARAAVAAALLATAGWAASETLTKTADYPSPLGLLRSLTVTGDAALARDGGAVTIGSPTADAKVRLNVGGAAKLGSTVDVLSKATASQLESSQGSLLLRPQASRPDAPVDGTLLYNSAAARLELSRAGAWIPASFPTARSTFTTDCKHSTSLIVNASFGAHTYCAVTGAVGAHFRLEGDVGGPWFLHCAWDQRYAGSPAHFEGQTNGGMVLVTCLD